MTEVDDFELKKSLLRRLRYTMIAISVFVLAGFFVIYLSNVGSLRGLTAINRANNIFALTTQALEGIDTSIQNLDKLGTNTTAFSDIRFSHGEAQKILKETILSAAQLAKENEEVHGLLMASYESMEQYEQSVEGLFIKVKAMPKPRGARELDDIKAELLVAQQFAMESKEGLRKAQIRMRALSDSLFSSIYASRFRPLILATTTSIIFFIFVVTFGFAISRKLQRAIVNLTKATQVVAKGDLSHEAPIIEPDEIGNLTHAFNKMVRSLSEGRNELRLTLDRIRSLQKITASFSEALTVEQVCDVTVNFGFEALGANSGTVALMVESGDELEIRRNEGIPDDTTAEWKKFSIKSALPMSDALRFSRPIFIEGQSEMAEKYPVLKEAVLADHLQAWAFVPLEVATSKLGVLGFYFTGPKKFSEEEKNFIISVGRQCAQALHRSELYDDAKAAIQARDEFLSIASHELKTPLTPLKLQLQMLARQAQKDQSVTPERLVKIVDTSDKQLGRLSRLIEDLLDVSRITTGRLTLNFEKFNLGEMVKDVIAQYGHQLKDALKRVEVSGSTDLEGEFDRVRLEQVLINLLTNAAKYAPGRPIKVHLEKNEGRARIMVSDQGPGIAKADQSRIFDRFERVRSNENIGGLGLGLYISKQIVLAHHGQIWVESELGKGSTFIIDVPLVQQPFLNEEAQFH